MGLSRPRQVFLFLMGWDTSRGPKILYEIPNPMVILARFQIPDQDSGFQAKILLLWL